MVALNKVRCLVFRVPAAEAVGSARSIPKPSELLPWADPYIAALVRKLQQEVRAERQETIVGEAELPWYDDFLDEDLPGEDRLPDSYDDSGRASLR